MSNMKLANHEETAEKPKWWGILQIVSFNIHTYTGCESHRMTKEIFYIEGD